MERRVGEVVLELEREFKEHGVPEPRLSAELIVMHVLGKDRAFLYTHPEFPVSERELERLRALSSRRKLREPLAYILGWREFFSRRFMVRKGVLVPRQETEVLVEAVLEGERPGSTMVDFGCGSGAIGITLALEMGGRIFLVDRDRTAVEVSKENAKLHGAKVSIVMGDDLSFFKDSSLDAIVSNPPYVKASELSLIDDEVRYEPLHAYYGGEDGLDVYRVIERDAWYVLRSGGRLYLEIGRGMLDDVKALFSRFRFVRSVKDLSGIDRVVVFERP